MAWSDPKREHCSVRDGDQHIGYLTIISYPNRDVTAFPEGTPYFEVVIAGLGNRHVALLQRFKEHWLVHCGTIYETTTCGGELTEPQIESLARFALRSTVEAPSARAIQLRERIEMELNGRDSDDRQN